LIDFALIHSMLCDMQTMLSNEWTIWTTIDSAVQNIDVGGQLVDKINEHIYVKFLSQQFVCRNGTISLPVSAPITLLILGL